MKLKQAIVAVIAVVVVAIAGWFAYPLLRPAQAPAPFFADWAAIVVAGDWRAQNGQPSEVFDNGRRELSRKFLSIGFRPDNLLQFSVRPQNYPGQNVRPATGDALADGLDSVAQKGLGGCMVYFTSHGSAEGIVVGNRLVPPAAIADLVDTACGERPTVVIMSACYAGQFIPALKGDNRIVFTAARHDRTSFGCGEQDEYTFFDNCVISEFDKTGNFSDLAGRVETCVAERERAMRVDLPSEPQFFLGPNVAYTLSWK